MAATAASSSSSSNRGRTLSWTLGGLAFVIGNAVAASLLSSASAHRTAGRFILSTQEFDPATHSTGDRVFMSGFIESPNAWETEWNGVQVAIVAQQRTATVSSTPASFPRPATGGTPAGGVAPLPLPPPPPPAAVTTTAASSTRDTNTSMVSGTRPRATSLVVSRPSPGDASLVGSSAPTTTTTVAAATTDPALTPLSASVARPAAVTETPRFLVARSIYVRNGANLLHLPSVVDGRFSASSSPGYSIDGLPLLPESSLPISLLQRTRISGQQVFAADRARFAALPVGAFVTAYGRIVKVANDVQPVMLLDYSPLCVCFAPGRQTEHANAHFAVARSLTFWALALCSASFAVGYAAL